MEKIRLYDTNGHLLKEATPAASAAAFDLSNMEANVYYLEVQTAGKRALKKIVKL